VYTLNFELEEKGKTRKLALPIRGALICGYTGRDQAAVRAHIAELETEGIAPPDSVPSYFPKAPAGVVTDEELVLAGAETCGEMEFVLLPQGDEIYVGAGSDHTDRALEKVDMTASKQITPAVVSRRLWNYRDVKAHWDRIEIRSTAVEKGKRLLYQESTLGTILPAEELMRLARTKVRGSLDGIAIYSGTPPLKPGRFVFAERFEGELADPVLKRKLTVHYDVRVIDWYKP
jgi:hypothetical protein